MEKTTALAKPSSRPTLSIRQPQLRGRLRRLLLGSTGIAALFAAWEYASRSGLANSALLPSPIAVAKLMGRMLEDGTLIAHMWASLVRAGAGFSLGFLAALAVGCLMGTWGTARRIIGPVIELFRPIPPFAVIPIAILWFGIGEWSKTSIIAYATFFPAVLNVSAGIKQVDPVHLKVVSSLGAGRWRTFRHVTIHSALPLIITGMKAGIGMAFVSLVAAEIVASSNGLGFLIQEGRSLFNTEQVIAGMIAIGMLGAALNGLLAALEAWLVRWK